MKDMAEKIENEITEDDGKRNAEFVVVDGEKDILESAVIRFITRSATAAVETSIDVVLAGSPLSEVWVSKLSDIGVTCIADLYGMTEKDLVSIRGIGPAGAKWIALAIAKRMPWRYELANDALDDDADAQSENRPDAEVYDADEAPEDTPRPEVGEDAGTDDASDLMKEVLDYYSDLELDDVPPEFADAPYEAAPDSENGMTDEESEALDALYNEEERLAEQRDYASSDAEGSDAPSLRQAAKEFPRPSVKEDVDVKPATVSSPAHASESLESPDHEQERQDSEDSSDEASSDDEEADGENSDTDGPPPLDAADGSILSILSALPHGDLLAARLSEEGIEVADDLIGLSIEDLSGYDGIGETAARRIAAAMVVAGYEGYIDEEPPAAPAAPKRKATETSFTSPSPLEADPPERRDENRDTVTHLDEATERGERRGEFDFPKRGVSQRRDDEPTEDRFPTGVQEKTPTWNFAPTRTTGTARPSVDEIPDSSPVIEPSDAQEATQPISGTWTPDGFVPDVQPSSADVYNTDSFTPVMSTETGDEPVQAGLGKARLAIAAGGVLVVAGLALALGMYVIAPAIAHGEQIEPVGQSEVCEYQGDIG